MKKIISSKSALVIGSFSAGWFFLLSMVPLGLVAFGRAEMDGAVLLVFGGLFGMSCFLLWVLNRDTCVVWVEDGIVKSKGLIGGFYKECPIRSIQSVKIQYSRHEMGFGTFVYLVTDETSEYKKFFRIRKDGYISFRKTKKNLDFLRTFWSGTIDE